jgi:RNA polymerase sigma-70 factor (ECF subfamily)
VSQTLRLESRERPPHSPHTESYDVFFEAVRLFAVAERPDRVMEGGTGFFAVVDDLRLARARRGDLDALEDLYRVYAQPVANLARRICRSAHEAEEVVQETFLEMVRSVRSYRGDGAFGAWLRRIAVSKALTSLRSRERRGESDGLASVERPTAFAMAVEGAPGWRKVDLERALALLPDDDRVVVWLFDVEGLTHREIAALFRRSESFSKSRLSRAHAKLRELLGSPGGNDASEPRRSVGAARR